MCAVGANRPPVEHDRRPVARLEAVLTWLGALQGPVTVGLEATLYREQLEALEADERTRGCSVLAPPSS